MKGRRHIKERIIPVLKEREAGLTTAEILPPRRDAHLLSLENEARGAWKAAKAKKPKHLEGDYALDTDWLIC
jgi:hypothetical protein